MGFFFFFFLGGDSQNNLKLMLNISLSRQFMSSLSGPPSGTKSLGMCPE